MHHAGDYKEPECEETNHKVIGSFLVTVQNFSTTAFGTIISTTSPLRTLPFLEGL